MAYSVYSFLSQYADTRADRHLRRHARGQPRRGARRSPCEQIADIAAGNLTAGRADARPGEPEGPAAALDGVDLGPDDAAREVARRPTRRSSRSTAWSPRSTRRRRGRLPRSRPSCSRPSGSRRPGSGRARSTSSAALEQRDPDARARRVRILLNGHTPPSPEMGKVGGGARARRSSRRATSSSPPRPRPRRWSTSRRPTAVVPNILRAVEAGVPCVVGTSGWDPDEVDGRAQRGRACRSSTRRTSRSARC